MANQQLIHLMIWFMEEDARRLRASAVANEEHLAKIDICQCEAQETFPYHLGRSDSRYLACEEYINFLDKTELDVRNEYIAQLNVEHEVLQTIIHLERLARE